MGPGDPFATTAAPPDNDADVDVEGSSPPRRRSAVDTATPRRLAPLHTPASATKMPPWVVPTGIAAGACIAVVGLVAGVIAAVAMVIMGSAGGLAAWLGYRMLVGGLHPRQAWRSLLGDDDS